LSIERPRSSEGKGLVLSQHIEIIEYTKGLAKQAEVELKAGLEMMGKDKKAIQELLALVDPPTTK